MGEGATEFSQFWASLTTWHSLTRRSCFLYISYIMAILVGIVGGVATIMGTAGSVRVMLAPIMVQEIFDLVKRVNKEGVTVMLVEQNVRQTVAMCHRAYVLENGRVILEGQGEQLLENEHLKEAFLGI